MADPLSLLRRYYTADRLDEVSLTGDSIDFGSEYSFRRGAATQFKSKAAGTERFYDVGTLLRLARALKAPDYKYAAYFKAAREEKVDHVALVDVKDLEAYLSGKQDTVDQIQELRPLELRPLEVAEPGLPSAKKARLEGGPAAAGAADAERSALASVAQAEWRLRDRQSQLSVPGANFAGVLRTLDAVLAQQEREGRERRAREVAEKEKKRREAEERANRPNQAKLVQPSGRYERETAQDATLRQAGAAGLGISQVGFVSGISQAGAPPPPPPVGGAPPRAPPPQQQPQPPKQPAPQQQQQQRQPARSGHRPEPSSGARPGGSSSGRRPLPIILVPSANSSAMINSLNARIFLEQGSFRSVEECRAEAGGAEPAGGGAPVTFVRKALREPPYPEYQILDRDPVSKDEWGRVVAVFCVGKAWQFRSWPFKGAKEGDTVEAFGRVFACYPHFKDESVPPLVKGWRTLPLALARETRHHDRTAAGVFWKSLDAHLRARGTKLTY